MPTNILVVDVSPTWANKHIPSAIVTATAAAALELLTIEDAFGLVVIGPGMRRRLIRTHKKEGNNERR